MSYPIATSRGSLIASDRRKPPGVDELACAFAAAAEPGQYRLLLVSGGTARSPEVLKDVDIDAADAPAAIRQASRIAWPPQAIGLILIDCEGRQVFGRDKPIEFRNGVDSAPPVAEPDNR
jgi:hypothetical protein